MRKIGKPIQVSMALCERIGVDPELRCGRLTANPSELTQKINVSAKAIKTASFVFSVCDTPDRVTIGLSCDDDDDDAEEDRRGGDWPVNF